MDMYHLPHVFTEERNVGTVERIASGAAAAALIGLVIRDIKKPTTTTWLELGGAAYLLFRGLLAYCPLKGFVEKEYPTKPSGQKNYSGE